MEDGQLTDLQLAIMNALWTLGPAGVADVTAFVSREGRELAQTTVATLLARLAKQEWVLSEKEGRQLIYRANVKRKDAAKSALGRVVSSFFGGRASALTAQLLELEDVTAEDVAEMRKLLKKRGG
jgi:predicted transcriptional regulator